MKRYDAAALKCALMKLLENSGVAVCHADVLLDCMMEADACGVHSHGLSVFPAYLNKLAQGAFQRDGNVEVLKETGAFALVDAQNLIGAVSAKQCMELALNRCAGSGIYTVFARNANTFGPAFYYANMAAEKKMIGLCFSNSPAAMPAWGGKKKILGTNPFALAIPGKKNGPILMDMATSIVAKSKINEIRKSGGTLPKGWAVDENGAPTVDPVEAIRGMVLPMAEHKGYAIAMAIDLLAGLLSGAGFLTHVNRFYSEDQACMNVGQCFVVMDPCAIGSEGFYEEVDRYIQEIHASGEDILIPGERKLRHRQEASTLGLALTEETAVALEALFQNNGIENGLISYEKE